MYETISDCLWYTGHILTGIAVVINHYEDNFWITILFVTIGQFLTMISRPIGRIKKNRILPILPISKNDLIT